MRVNSPLATLLASFFLACGGGSTPSPSPDQGSDPAFPDTPSETAGEEVVSPDAMPSDPGTTDILAPCKTDEDCAPEDASPCIVGTCDRATATCVFGPAPDGTKCDPADACLEDALCKGGACQGAPRFCDDGNPCTDDSCDKGTGCVFTPNTAPCDDGNPCTATDACMDGLCAGSDNQCPCASDDECTAMDDGNACNGMLRCDAGFCVLDPAEACGPRVPSQCTVPTCTPATGQCENVPVPEGTKCDDGNLCTQGEMCLEGACTPAQTIVCDDFNVCTEDACDPAVGCTFTPKDGSCDDGNGCTKDDTCKQGHCVGTATAECGCVTATDCAKFEDSNACNGTLTCVAGQCVVDPKTVVYCDTAKDTACLRSECDPKTGTCVQVPAPEGRPCDDEDTCTPVSTCEAGTCVGNGTILECDDGNPCTLDSCDKISGCVHAPFAGPCDDGDACTVGDVCQAGICKGASQGCDDGNPCTDDSCNPALGCAHANNTAPCSDGTACTTGDTCVDGECVGAPIQDCDDGNPCTDDWCDPTTGCNHANNTAACDDGDACTAFDACENGACASGEPLGCDDGNPCTDDACDKLTGCLHENNTLPCDDLSACTEGDTCMEGVCVGQALKDCDDDNPCTDDSCDVLLGCVYAPNTLACDDQNACTTGDTCADGECKPGEAVLCEDGNECTDDVCDKTLGCIVVNNTISCDDGNACTTVDRCDEGRCVGSEFLDCDDKNPCTTDACDITWGCVNEDNTLACDDQNACTTSDVCQEGICLGGPAPSCDDGNPCTDDACDPAVGCVHQNNAAPCDDQNACTILDACVDGQCTGTGEPACDDGNPCTDDGCDSVKGCSYLPNTLPCDDGDACTTADACKEGTCQGGPAPNCDDGNPCTTDSCDPVLGCLHANNTDACDDNNPCTTEDACRNGACVGGPPKDCEDGNPCTSDDCLPAVGCVHVNNNNPCSDGSACTINDSCSGGKCVPGAALVCEDYNPCTRDSCDASTGCGFTPKADGSSCDDGNPCTSEDMCTSGKCSGVGVICDDNNPCTTDSCDPASQKCIFTPNANACEDGNVCTLNDKCTEGKCVGGVALNCNDGNVCTTDSCDPKAGCTYVNNAEQCTDNNACTIGDKCANGVCQSGSPINCDDNNVCTTDACDPLKGCVYVNNSRTCNDGNPCTPIDTCVEGKCVGSGTLDCNDNNPCTTDSCDPLKGCVYMQNTDACEDENACTVGDTCAAGKCVPGSAANCDDQNVCTTDSCDPKTGCVHANNTVACEDGNACTKGDACAGGLCVGGPPLSCDDGNPCTTDSCNPGSGCVHVNNSLTCNDGNECTTQDTCMEGKCVGGAPPNCNDGNICTTDACDPKFGCTHENNTLPCEDGSLCTQNDRCTEGRCVGGPYINCDDGKVCTTDGCEPKVGCTYKPNTLPCDDKNACTTLDTCADGICVGGPLLKCDDGEICTSDTCDPLKGCVFTPNTLQCDDKNACTTKDGCVGGKCVGGPPLECDDKNVCTSDTCIPAVGCVFVNNENACDDGNPCTEKDVCKDGKCQGGTPKVCDDYNPCTKDTCDPLKGCVFTPLPDGTLCDDGNGCTTNDRCKAGKCTGVGKQCDDNNPCTDDKCDSVVGCYYVANNNTCDDGNVCTTGDLCVNKQCVGQGALDCSDGNLCTDDKCDAKNGCFWVPNTAPCDDKNPCTTNDACSGGKCLGGPALDCDDGNPCTDDWCTPTSGCVHKNNTASCEDGDPCTTKDTCAGGKCVGGPPRNCDDGNVCTDDRCDTGIGCTHTFNTAKCDDGNACTLKDVCNEGKCTGSGSPNCDDTNPCTTDWCDPTLGCQHANNTLPCEDGNACTEGDACQSGSCIGKAVNCNDDNDCTTDSCDKGKGCLHQANSIACDDGNACTTGDRCNAFGKCSGTLISCDDGQECTADTCDSVTGCVHLAFKNGAACGSLGTGGICFQGVCMPTCSSLFFSQCCDYSVIPAVPINCNDGRECTFDSCDPKIGCQHTNNTIVCNDGNACSAPDKCTNGTCAGTPFPITACDDANPCTSDSCDKSKGCLRVPVKNGTSCKGGSCWFGVCLPI